MANNNIIQRYIINDYVFIQRKECHQIIHRRSFNKYNMSAAEKYFAKENPSIGLGSEGFRY